MQKKRFLSSLPARQILLYSIFIVLAAQINLDVFTNNFRVSIGILLFPVYLFLDEKIPLIPLTFCSAIGVFLSRVVILSFRHGFSVSLFGDSFPECIFYLVYGILSFFYFRHRKGDSLNRFTAYVPLFFMDYAANLCELFVRLKTDAFAWRLQFSILLVAFLRTLILWAVLSGLGHYKFLLLSREHSERYQRLILLISKLNGEIIWMKKNTALMENTMRTSYKLFEDLNESGANSRLSQNALTVAKDIHEIKKEYMLILRGISDALEMNLQDDAMSLSGILLLLKNALLSDGKPVQLNIRLETDIFTDRHYFLLSIFRNLFNNAIEAAGTAPVQISFQQSEKEQSYLFEITDNGPGIAPEDMEQIFVPGFSTKINFETGEISRGLGLNLVKDLIETQLNGSIRVTSVPGQTSFYISIPKNSLEDTKNEILFD